MRTRDVRARAGATAWGLLVLFTDLLPPRVRYGYVHRLTRAAFARPLPSLPRPDAAATDAVASPAASGIRTGAPVCVLAADSLDVGGIGSVIEALALGLSDHGIRPIVLCPDDGERAAQLRDCGVEVLLAEDETTAIAALAAADPDVIQLHSAPPSLERAAIASGKPLVPVMHNTEIHFTRARWSRFDDLMARSFAGVAVSETVGDFHRRNLGSAASIVVVPNGAPAPPAPQPDDRRIARERLSALLGLDIGADVVFLCLARYDAQKNTAGLVAAFGEAAATAPTPVRMVWAGDPSDWAEVRRAGALRRSGPAADRVHLLGNSDARALLAAADAFVLDSFFEGWPMAATEAAAFGLPLLLSDVGGARELVARDPERCVLIPNATGEAGRVSDARVRRARWRSRCQPNAADLQTAVARIAQGVRGRTASAPASTPRGSDDLGGVQTMLAGHAAVIRDAAGYRHPEAAGSDDDDRVTA
ncbi:glycosyltransferase family 4 protein [Microbacterium aerolatum]|uniref:glycosyltransferase family 4 protein n=1 Tax=Microbacterium aerolatum TaxID=153731 RepID=UPI00385097B3